MNRFCYALAAMVASAAAMALAEDGARTRPAWLDQATDGTLPLHTDAVVSELWATQDEARRHAFELAATRAADFAAESAPHLKGRWDVPLWVVRDHLLKEPMFIEQVDWTYGPMYKAHALLDLSPDKREVILSQWHSVVVQKRVSQVGGSLGFLLVCVATLLGYLRLDDATRGYYSRWLATAALAVVTASGAALYQWIS